MFEKVRIDLNQADLKKLIQDRVMAEYGQECNVDFEVNMEASGFGMAETYEPRFGGAKVYLIPKKAKQGEGK